MTEHLDAAAEPLDLPLVGRADALAAVDGALEDAADGAGRALLVTGPAGVGKTALLAALRERARERGFVVFSGTATPSGPVAFEPVVDAFEGASAGTGVPGYLRSPDGPVPEDPEAFTAQRNAQFHDVADEVRAMATVDPVVVAVDDLQHADAGTLALFEHFAAEIREFPVLVVGAGRPAADDGTTDGRADQPADAPQPATPEGDDGIDAAGVFDRVSELEHATHLALGPLDAAGTRDLLAALLGVDPPAPFVELVVDATGGLPALVRETVALWREAGVLDPAAGEYPTDAGAVEAPADLAAAVADRVAALPAAQRRVLGAVAVLGGRTSRSLLAAALDDEPAGAALDALAAAGLLEREGETVSLAGGPVRSAALADAPDDWRRSVAARAATAAERPGVAAARHEAAGERERAVERYVAAAEAAAASFAPRVAATATELARALAAADGRRERARELALAAGEHHLAAGDAATAAERFRTVRAADGDPELAARACVVTARLHRHEGDLDAAVGAADDGLALPEGAVPASVRRALYHEKGRAALDAGDLETARAAFEAEVEAAAGHRERAVALTDRGVVERRGSDLEQARELLTAAVEHAEASGDDRAVARAVRKLAIVDDQLGDLERAVEEYRRLIARLQAEGDAVDLPTAMMDLGACYFNLGRLEEAAGRYETAIEMARRVDQREIEAIALGNLGLARVVLGDVHEAVANCEEAIDILYSLGWRDRAAMRQVTLAFAQYLLDDTEAALSTCGQALSVARDTGQKYALGYALKFRGRFRRADGDLAGAVEDHEESVAVMADLGNARHEADARAQLAEDHLAAGRPDAALTAAEAAFGTAWDLEHPLLVARVAARLGRVRRERGDLRGAAAALDGARVRQRDRRDVLEETWTRLELARLERDRGDPGAARTHLDRGHALADDAGFERYRRIAGELRAELEGGD